MIRVERNEALDNLPYGKGDLVSRVRLISQNPRQVRCYVQGCERVLRTPTRNDRGEVCPDHGIRCHHSSAGSTYSYADPKRNVIASRTLFDREIIGHPFKYESHRLGLERSEDTLSWNVFRSLEESDLLWKLTSHIVGEEVKSRPYLFLWGIQTTDDSMVPWNLLLAARERFESNLPVDRPQTEPDIALYLPGHYLILIEAKFCSPNTYYQRGPRKDGSSLTLEELLSIYTFAGQQQLDLSLARTHSRVFYQLWRNMTFAEWMAKQCDPNTKAFHVNLVREGFETEAAHEFARLVPARYENRFQRLTWEQIYNLLENESGIERMQRYMETKTAGLEPAFKLNRAEVDVTC